MSDQEIGYQGCWIPAAILVHERLTDLDQKVYGIINGFTANGLVCWASNKRIGLWLNRDEESISRSIGRLVEENLCERTIDKEGGNRRTLSSRQPIAILTPADTLSSSQPTIYNKDNIKDNKTTASALPSAEKTIEEAIITNDDVAVSRIMQAAMDKKIKLAQKRAKAKMTAVFSKEFEAAYAAWPTKPDKLESWGRWLAASQILPAEQLEKKCLEYVEEKGGKYCQNMIAWFDARGWESVGRLPSYGQSCQKPENGLVMTKKRPSHEQVIEQFLAFSKVRGAKEAINAFYSDTSKWREYAKNSQCTHLQLFEKIRLEIPVENCGNIFKETLDNG